MVQRSVGCKLRQSSLSGRTPPGAALRARRPPVRGGRPGAAAVAAADWVAAQPAAQQQLSASAALDKATALASSIDYEQLGNTALGAGRTAADAAGRLAGEAVAPFNVFGSWPLNLLFLGVVAAMTYSIAIAPRQ